MPFVQPIFKWNAVGSLPPQSFIDNGLKPLDGLPAGWMNGWLNRTSLALEELQKKAGEIKTVNGNAPDESGNIILQTGGGTATTVSIVDTGNYYTSNNVEGALQEIGLTMNTIRGSLITSANGLLGG